jgi:peroxiredoxin
MRRYRVNLTVLLALAVAGTVLPAESLETFTLGAPVADFSIIDMNGQPISYSSLRGKATVLIFFSTRCPMSNAFNFRRNQLYLEYGERVNFLVVDSNSNESAEEIRAYAKSVEFDYPVYRDPGNILADRFGAQVTTDTFVIDSSGVIRYHGFIEDSPNPARAKTKGLRLALDAVLEARPVAMPEGHALGCSIRRVRP